MQLPKDFPLQAPDLVCFSHLRWDSVFQRPQHLMSRFARNRRVFFVEEPVFEPDLPAEAMGMRTRQVLDGLWVVTPVLRNGIEADAVEALQQTLLERWLHDQDAGYSSFWYYTPMAMGFTRALAPVTVAYDCMDELAAFKGAPRALLAEREGELFGIANVVFTGGQSLFEAKRQCHPNVHLFASSVDVAHFARARTPQPDPPEQAAIGHPRIGFAGVIDERMDLVLLETVARLRPDWQFVLVGPVAIIDPATLPRRENFHYLGPEPYTDLPAYLAGWDLAVLPFARNESTRHLSPTKTPEYLAAGRPAVATPMRDVVHPYGHKGLVRIAETAEAFVAAGALAMGEDTAESGWLVGVDAFVGGLSWERTWAGMAEALGRSEALAIDARWGASR